MTLPTLLSNFRELAPQHDALICDVWGVLHNGRVTYQEAADALRNFKNNHGPVILLTNAPRPVADLEVIFQKLGVPLDCYDAIMTSGVAARAELAQRAGHWGLKLLHLGPERDRGVFAGLPLECPLVETRKAALGAVDAAEIVLNTGLYDDETEKPKDYHKLFQAMKDKNLTMLCANPDIVVERGDKLIWCAGALARDYAKLGGDVIYYGKPHKPIYDTVLALAAKIAGRAPTRSLAIGDGADTDIKGANAMGIDALFIAQGVHAAQLGDFTADGIAQFFAVPGVHAKAAMRALVW
ncbi:MAG TPA: TIGR01459 family HAD-type hydrolase [Rhizomicrobium sp.]|jgi:HAD superfamily hydrolase (TIGR01459 family)|nr:TIGR01459 family HAD-type hydrolase [Rhizomicrobium sp.]